MFVMVSFCNYLKVFPTDVAEELVVFVMVSFCNYLISQKNASRGL